MMKHHKITIFMIFGFSTMIMFSMEEQLPVRKSRAKSQSTTAKRKSAEIKTEEGQKKRMEERLKEIERASDIVLEEETVSASKKQASSGEESEDVEFEKELAVVSTPKKKPVKKQTHIATPMPSKKQSHLKPNLPITYSINLNELVRDNDIAAIKKIYLDKNIVMPLRGHHLGLFISKLLKNKSLAINDKKIDELYERCPQHMYTKEHLRQVLEELKKK